MAFTKAQAARVKKIINSGNLEQLDDQDYLDVFVEYYTSGDEMPYGTQKARDGDPFEWTANKIDSMSKSELLKLVDTLTESAQDTPSIRERFETNQLNESLTYRQRQLHKTMDQILDDLDRLDKLSRPTSVMSKMIKECEGDDVALAAFHKKILAAYDDMTNIMMSCFAGNNEN